MALRFDEVTLTTRKTDGPKLYVKEVLPEGTPRALCAVVHGYADHAGRYARVMERLAERGIAAIGLDLRGHGRAEGPRGHVTSFDEYADDIDELRARVDAVATREGCTDVPRVLFGHSMGGLVTYYAMLRSAAGWDALAHTGPLFGLALQVPWIKRVAAKGAARLYPRLALPTGLSGDQLTHDTDIAAQYDKDPLGFKTATAGWFVAMLAAQERCFERAPEMKLPYWVCHGGADPINALSRTRAVYERTGSERKEWVEAPGLFHEVLNEPEWRPIADSLAKFVLTAREQAAG